MRTMTHFLKLICLGLVLSIGLLYGQVEVQIARDDARPQQCYGFNVDLEDDIALIGAYHDDPTEEDICNGSVYFNTWNGATWEQTQKIEYSNSIPIIDAGFGYAVKMQGDAAMIGCPWDFTGNTLTGAVHYYHYNGTEWVFGQQLKPSNEGGFDDFGLSVDTDGDFAIVGAPGTDHVLNTQIPDEMNYGAAYIFHWDGSDWVEQQMLTASDGTSFDSFGCRVAIEDSVAVVAAYTAGIDNLHAEGPGQVYVYTYNGTSWEETQILTADDGQNGDWFGRSITINNSRIVVGSLKAANGVAGISGASYCYEWDGSQWAQTQKIVPSAVPITHFFGSSIDIYDNTMVIGGAFWASPADGRAFVYTYENGQWQEDHTLVHSNPSPAGDDFGNGVAIYGTRILAGAPWRDTQAAIFSGSAYMYHYEDMAPVAIAGDDFQITENESATLDGSASYDPEGGAITYLWTAPAGIALSDPTSVTPSFTAPDITEPYIQITFSLVVSDGALNSLPEEVTVTVMNENSMPVANSGSDANAMEETVFMLDGSASYDPEGSPITYLWSAPASITLSDNTSEMPTFMTPEVDEDTDLIFSLIVNDGQFDSFADSVTITIQPILPVDDLEYDEDTMTASWIAPGAQETDFRYDDGTATGQLGANSSTAMMGSAHAENAILEEISWYLTSEGGPHPVVTVAVFGLTPNGTPNESDILYMNDTATSNDDQWNTITFDEPIEAPDGFFLGLNYDGFLALALDDGVGAPYDFTPGTQWVVFDWTAGGWENLEAYDYTQSFMVRASGLSFGPLNNEASAYTTQPAQHSADFLRYTALDQPVATQLATGSRFFTESYNIYLNDQLIEAAWDQTQYQLPTNLPSGDYTLAVAALYDEGESEWAEVSFEYTAPVDAETPVVLATTLQGNYPNPFNPSTTISYSIKTASDVELHVFNAKGQKVITLVNEPQEAGHYSIQWNGTDTQGKEVSSGIYFYRMQTDTYEQTHKMILMK